MVFSAQRAELSGGDGCGTGIVVLTKKTLFCRGHTACARNGYAPLRKVADFQQMLHLGMILNAVALSAQTKTLDKLPFGAIIANSRTYLR
jgi:hypothetical protein